MAKKWIILTECKTQSPSDICDGWVGGRVVLSNKRQCAVSEFTKKKPLVKCPLANPTVNNYRLSTETLRLVWLTTAFYSPCTIGNVHTHIHRTLLYFYNYLLILFHHIYLLNIYNVLCFYQILLYDNRT